MSLSDAIDTAKQHPILTTLGSIFALVAGSRVVHAFERDPVNAGIGTAFGLAAGALTKKFTDSNLVAAGVGIAGGLVLPHVTQAFLTDITQRTVNIPNHTAEQVAAMVVTYAAVYTAANMIGKTNKAANNILGFISGLYAYAYTAPIIHPIVEAVKHAL